MSPRQYHATLAMIVVFPLFLTAVTGAAYRIARAWFDAPKSAVHWLLDVHTMGVLSLHAVYPVLVGCSAVAMCLTGAQLLRVDAYFLRLFKRVTGRAAAADEADAQSGGATAVGWWPAQWTARSTHRFVVSLVMLPLAVTAGSGVVWTLLRFWSPAAFDPAPAHRISKWMMALHQGSWTLVLSPASFVPILGFGTIVVLVTGFRMIRFAIPAALTARLGGGSGHTTGDGHSHSYAPVGGGGGGHDSGTPTVDSPSDSDFDPTIDDPLSIGNGKSNSAQPKSVGVIDPDAAAAGNNK